MNRPALALAATVTVLLACSGVVTDEPTVDPADPAKVRLDLRDYTGAELILQQRLRADPRDTDARILLGDVGFTRGQDFPDSWKDNLVLAREQWVEAVRQDPSRCDAWRRLAVAVLAAAPNEEITTPREVFDALPTVRGWKLCGGAPLLALADAAPTTGDELDGARATLGQGSFDAATLAAARPSVVDGLGRLPLDGLVWEPGFSRPAATAGGWFVVLEPGTAQGVDGAAPRSFTHPERVRIASAGQRIVFDDFRFPARVPAEGVTLATACPGTEWRLEGPDRVAAGWCIAGPHDARRAPVYDPDRLVPTGAAHWEHSTFDDAALPAEEVAEGSARCVAGAVGRMYVDTPTCKVAYDRAIPQRRAVAAALGLPARDAAHADRMLAAHHLGPAWGEALADHLARGEVAAGMPHTLFVRAAPDPGPCAGRGLFQRTRLDGAHVTFTCPVDGRDWTFEDLALATVPAAP